MAWKDDDITPAVLLQHMQEMEQRLRKEIHPVCSEFGENRQIGCSDDQD